MSQKFLIPLDGSPLGEAALRYAASMLRRLAPGEKVEVTLFHVITAQDHSLYVTGGEVIHVPYSQEELEEMKKKAERYLTEAGKQLDCEAVSVNAKVIVGPSEATEILKMEEECGADLVIMSTHGRGGIARFAYGSVADKVLRAGTVPVLLIRAKEE